MSRSARINFREPCNRLRTKTFAEWYTGVATEADNELLKQNGHGVWLVVMYNVQYRTFSFYQREAFREHYEDFSLTIDEASKIYSRIVGDNRAYRP